MPPGTSPQNDELPTEPDKHKTTSILQPFSKTTWVSQYQKSKTILVFKEADCDVEVLGWKWNRPDYLQTICTLLQIHNHANISSLNFFYGCSSWCPTNSVKALKATGRPWHL